jgi:hypothetical protein
MAVVLDLSGNGRNLTVAKVNGTNPVCEKYVEGFDYCGCQRCGHTRGEHHPITSAHHATGVSERSYGQ